MGLQSNKQGLTMKKKSISFITGSTLKFTVLFSLFDATVAFIEYTKLSHNLN